jgi:hypothetical protein
MEADVCVCALVFIYRYTNLPYLLELVIFQISPVNIEI